MVNESLYHLALVLYALKDFSAARLNIEELLRIEPDQVQVITYCFHARFLWYFVTFSLYLHTVYRPKKSTRRSSIDNAKKATRKGYHLNLDWNGRSVSVWQRSLQLWQRKLCLRIGSDCKNSILCRISWCRAIVNTFWRSLPSLPDDKLKWLYTTQHLESAWCIYNDSMTVLWPD